jgi:hypothetical protein
MSWDKMHWILIFWILTGGEGEFGGLHATAATVAFDDESACRSAFAAMKVAKNQNQGLWGVCVPQASH